MPVIFGKFSDSYKPKIKIDAWNTAEKLFFDKDYTGSYEALFNYLRDDDENNVSFRKTPEGGFTFELLQGSKKITGKVDGGLITAEANIATYEKPSVAFMRRLMEMNYTLFYTRIAFAPGSDNRIVIRFCSRAEASPPRKLYYGWKELATRADKQDDLLIDDFKMLKKHDDEVTEPLSDTEKEIKYNFFKAWLDTALSRVAGLNEEIYTGGISYLLLNTVYKIYYMLAPEGTLMHELEKMNWDYFTKDNKSYLEKNRKIKESLEKLNAIPKDEILADLYRVKSTFGIANPAPHQAVVDLFKSNLQNVKANVDNNNPDIAIAVYEYTATYCLFMYGLPKPDIKLFHLMLNVTNQDFFTALGEGVTLYDAASGKFHEDVIKKQIAEIIAGGLELYPELKFNADNLKFDSLLSFLKSFTAEMEKMNYNG